MSATERSESINNGYGREGHHGFDPSSEGRGRTHSPFQTRSPGLLELDPNSEAHPPQLPPKQEDLISQKRISAWATPTLPVSIPLEQRMYKSLAEPSLPPGAAPPSSNGSDPSKSPFTVTSSNIPISPPVSSPNALFSKSPNQENTVLQRGRPKRASAAAKTDAQSNLLRLNTDVGGGSFHLTGHSPNSNTTASPGERYSSGGWQTRQPSAISRQASTEWLNRPNPAAMNNSIGANDTVANHYTQPHLHQRSDSFFDGRSHPDSTQTRTTEDSRPSDDLSNSKMERRSSFYGIDEIDHRKMGHQNNNHLATSLPGLQYQHYQQQQQHQQQDQQHQQHHHHHHQHHHPTHNVLQQSHSSTGSRNHLFKSGTESDSLSSHEIQQVSGSSSLNNQRPRYQQAPYTASRAASLHDISPNSGPNMSTSQLLLDHSHLHTGPLASLLSHEKTLDLYRANARKTNDPDMQFEFCTFVMEVVAELEAQSEAGSLNNSTREKESMGESGGSSSIGGGGGGGHQALIERGTSDKQQALVSESVALLSKLANRGHVKSQYFLADCYTQGIGTVKRKRDYDKAFPLFILAGKHGHAEACFRAAQCCENGWGCKRDPGKSVAMLRRASVLGHPGAMHRLSLAEMNGELNLAKRPKEGLKWLKRAAELADQVDPPQPQSLHELALLHEKGIENVVFQDEEYSAELLARAAELQYAPSAYKLGECYEYGRMGCPQDSALSIHYYNIAAQQDHREACFALTAWYLVGSPGVLPQSDAEAYLWAKKAADMDLAKAEYAVGYFTEMGIGCHADNREAVDWFRKAASHGDRRAVDKLRQAGHSVSQYPNHVVPPPPSKVQSGNLPPVPPPEIYKSPVGSHFGGVNTLKKGGKESNPNLRDGRGMGSRPLDSTGHQERELRTRSSYSSGFPNQPTSNGWVADRPSFPPLPVPVLDLNITSGGGSGLELINPPGIQRQRSHSNPSSPINGVYPSLLSPGPMGAGRTPTSSKNNLVGGFNQYAPVSAANDYSSRSTPPVSPVSGVEGGRPLPARLNQRLPLSPGQAKMPPPRGQSLPGRGGEGMALKAPNHYDRVGGGGGGEGPIALNGSHEDNHQPVGGNGNNLPGNHDMMGKRERRDRVLQRGGAPGVPGEKGGGKNVNGDEKDCVIS